MATYEKFVGQVITQLVSSEAHSATKYLSPTEVITATRRLVRGKVDRRRNIEIVLKLGRPNYDEREFIRNAKKAGEPFPIKRILLKSPPKAKK